MMVFQNIFPLIALCTLMLIGVGCSTSNSSEVAVDAEKNNIMATEKKWDNDNPVKKPIQIDSSITIDYLMGKFEPNNDKRFVTVDKAHADRAGLYLRKETYAAFLKMTEAAKQDGINFIIKSATRNFNYQKGIWERKWTGKTKINGKDINKITREVGDKARIILQFSSMPGSSRHHWGTDFDLNAFNNSYFEEGKGLKEYEWLTANASKFGFCQPYTPLGKGRPNGYEEEKWHWSYIPISKTLTEQAGLRITNEMIQGFEGDFTAQSINVVDNYILGINRDCLD